MRWQRLIRLALVAAVASAAGCSAFVAARGVDVNALDTKEQAHHAFGTPATSGGADQPYDEFRTHRKLSERWRGEYLVIPCVVTLGLSEIVLLPVELYGAARQRVVGHTLRFGYDADGNVITASIDGETPHWLWRRQPPVKDAP